jgi:hypothetical protein
MENIEKDELIIEAVDMGEIELLEEDLVSSVLCTGCTCNC